MQKGDKLTNAVIDRHGDEDGEGCIRVQRGGERVQRGWSGWVG